MGLNFCPDFLEERPVGEENPGTVAAVVRHAKHIANIGGTEVLGLGSDFDGIECAPRNLEHPGDLPNLWNELRRMGYSEAAIEGIAGGNLRDYFRRLA